jgi:nitrate reductase assembly molybdenum cofactor insertion protein NarJ
LASEGPAGEGLAILRAALSQHPVEELAGRHLHLFDLNKHRVSLYETEYGRMRGLSKGKELADISGFYRAFGFTVDEGERREMPDHLAAELEFYAALVLKSALLREQGDTEGVAIVDAARASFLRDHLGRFAQAIAEQPAVQADTVLGPAFAWIADVVARECGLLGVDPPPLDFFAAEAEADEVRCGSEVCIPTLTRPEPPAQA